MTTMRAVVFRGKGQIGVEEVPKPVPRAGRGRHQDHCDDDLRHRRAHRARRISRQARPRARPRAGRRD